MNKISLDIDSGIRMIYPYRSNKGLNPKSPEGHPDRQTPEEAQRVEQMKHCDNNNKDENNSPQVNSVNKKLKKTSGRLVRFWVVGWIKNFSPLPVCFSKLFFHTYS